MSSTQNLARNEQDSSNANPTARLKNLGPKSYAMLASAGIHNMDDLRHLGAIAAYSQVKRLQPNKASLNLLWALAGALRNVHWRVVAKEDRASLLLALEQYEHDHS